MESYSAKTYLLNDGFSLESIKKELVINDSINGHFKIVHLNSNKILKKMHIVEPLTSFDMTAGQIPKSLGGNQYKRYNYKKTEAKFRESIDSLEVFLNQKMNSFFHKETVNRIITLLPFIRVSMPTGAVVWTHLFIVENFDSSKWLYIFEPTLTPFSSDFMGPPIEFKESYSKKDLDLYINIFLHSFDHSVRSSLIPFESAYRNYPNEIENEMEGSGYSFQYKLADVLRYNLRIDILNAKEVRYLTVSNGGIITKDMVDDGVVSLFYNKEDCAVNFNYEDSETKRYRENIVSTLIDSNMLIHNTNRFTDILGKESTTKRDEIFLSVYRKQLVELQKKYKITLNNEVTIQIKNLAKEERGNSIKKLGPIFDLIKNILSLMGVNI